ncbi:MAG: molybdopterin-dependent oxidoreductase [Acidimicrobiia bacterium]|nr:molybdopterin-dependent oxidoreductase [Acidimicrobiia bacterium]
MPPSPGPVLDPLVPHSSHWGAFGVRVEDGRVVDVVPHPADPDPSPLLGNIASAVAHAARVATPAVRRGWLDRGPGPDASRGADSFVAVSWDEALDLVAGELRRAYDGPGAEAIFGGSYGWGSAGRFHSAPTQVRRLLGLLGGYTGSVNTYSTGASMVILPHVLGSGDAVMREATSWEVIAEHTELLVAFGGAPAKNISVTHGGVATHTAPGRFRKAARRGLEVALFSPLRSDVPAGVRAQWFAVRPGTDVAAMLALAHVLITEDLHDQGFLDRCCAGADRFVDYVTGAKDGVAKSPEWAAPICEVPAEAVRALARRMAASRTLVTTSWSLQRAEHGEQTVWAGVALAALLGQLGTPGGGFGHGYGSIADIGSSSALLAMPSLSPGPNPASTFIPVARIADLLLQPGELFEYDGDTYVYPDIRLVYWAGGNPFHHHQDLNRLRRALARPDTVVVHEPFWTPMARHADIVLPATTSLERNDIGAGRRDSRVIAMKAAVAPLGEARDDYDILAAVAERLGAGERFTEGRDERAWLEHLYEQWRGLVARQGVKAPSFEAFWSRGEVQVPVTDAGLVYLEAFVADPAKAPLRTPSGRIELASEVVEGFDYDDCPGHPAWLEPEEWLGSRRAARFPLHLVANQPATRLHSQHDMGAASQAGKVAGREAIRVHPLDAAVRGVEDGDVVRVFNDRGACLAGAVVSEDVRPGVVQLPTGAWYDPVSPSVPGSLCAHGNPNVLTPDRGTSRLAQGSIGQHALVELERFEGDVPPVRAHVPPVVERR